MKCSKCGCTFNSGTQVGEDEYLCTSCSTQDEIELPPQMMIYKIIRPGAEPGSGYDMYDSAVVTAPDALTAQKTHPHKGVILSDDARPDDWCPWKDVQVVEIGKALPGLEQGVVCASFNAA